MKLIPWHLNTLNNGRKKQKKILGYKGKPNRTLIYYKSNKKFQLKKLITKPIIIKASINNKRVLYKKLNFLYKPFLKNKQAMAVLTKNKIKKIIRNKSKIKFRTKRWKIRKILRKIRYLGPWNNSPTDYALLPNWNLHSLNTKKYGKFFRLKKKLVVPKRRWRGLRLRRNIFSESDCSNGLRYFRTKRSFYKKPLTYSNMQWRFMHTGTKINKYNLNSNTKTLSKFKYKVREINSKFIRKARRKKKYVKFNRKRFYIKKKLKSYFIYNSYRFYKLLPFGAINKILYHRSQKILFRNTKWISTQLLQNTREKNTSSTNKYYHRITTLLKYIEKLKNILLLGKGNVERKKFCLKKKLQYRIRKKLYQKKYRNHKRKTWNGVIKNSFYWKRLMRGFRYKTNGINFAKRREKTNFISLNPRFWVNKFRFGSRKTKNLNRKFKRRGFVGSYHSYPWLNPILYKKRLYRIIRDNVYLRLKRPNYHKRNKIYFNYTRTLFNKWTPAIKKQRYFYLNVVLSKIILAVYGHLKLKQFKQIVKSNNRIKPKQNTRLTYLLNRLERRLDVLVYRLNIAPTIQWARELIRLGMISVDSIVTQKPNYLVNNFALIQYSSNKKHRDRLKLFFNKKLFKKAIPPYLLYNPKLAAGILLHSPNENMLPANDRVKMRLLNILRLINNRINHIH